MITVSNNDLRQLLLLVKASCRIASPRENTQLKNRVRLAKITLKKLMKRPDVKRIMSIGKKVVVADK